MSKVARPHIVRALMHRFGGDRPRHLLARYASVGVVSALVELLLFQLLHGVVQLPVMASNVIAIVAVMVFGFLAQKRYTFRNVDPPWAQAGRYVLMVGSSFALNNALVFLFAVKLAWPAMLAKLVQLALSFAFNFTVSRFVVFRRIGARD